MRTLDSWNFGVASLIVSPGVAIIMSLFAYYTATPITAPNEIARLVIGWGTFIGTTLAGIIMAWVFECDIRDTQRKRNK